MAIFQPVSIPQKLGCVKPKVKNLEENSGQEERGGGRDVRGKNRHVQTRGVYCQNIFNEKMILQKLDNPSASLQGGLIVGAIITVVSCASSFTITFASRLEKHDRYRMQLIGPYNL